MGEEDKLVPRVKMTLSVTPQLVYYFEQLAKGEGGMAELMGKSVPEVASTLVAGEIEKLIAEGSLDKMSPERVAELEEQARKQEAEARIQKRARRTGRESTTNDSSVTQR
jgi:hypothetical protein